MMCRCGFIDCNKCTNLVRDVDNLGSLSMCMCEQKILFNIIRGFRVRGAGLCCYSKMSPNIQVYYVFLLHNFLSSFPKMGVCFEASCRHSRCENGWKSKGLLSVRFSFYSGEKCLPRNFCFSLIVQESVTWPPVAMRGAGRVFLFLASLVEEGK